MLKDVGVGIVPKYFSKGNKIRVKTEKDRYANMAKS